MACIGPTSTVYPGHENGYVANIYCEPDSSDIRIAISIIDQDVFTETGIPPLNELLKSARLGSAVEPRHEDPVMVWLDNGAILRPVNEIFTKYLRLELLATKAKCHTMQAHDTKLGILTPRDTQEKYN